MRDKTYNNYYDSVEYFSRQSLDTVIFEEGITHIGDYAFCGHSGGENTLSTVILPSTLRTVGSHAFAYCKYLTEVTFGDSIRTVEDHAFYECQSLSVNTLPESLTDIGDYSFYNCDGINIDILIHENIRRVGSHAFYDCDGIPKITVKSADTELSTYAFAECSTVKELLIPVDYDIANNPFNGISTVERITYSFGNSGKMRDKTYNNYDSVEYCSRQSLDTVIFEEGITHIGDYAFCGQSNVENTLSTVILPSTLKSIGSHAFAYCKYLTEITLPKGLAGIESHAFSDSSIAKIVFCGDAPSFDPNAFSGLCAAAYYPRSNSTWNRYSKLQYGGDITWVKGDENTHFHVMGYFEAKAPTCTSAGWNAYEACSTCDYSTYEEIPETGHDYLNGICTVCKKPETDVPTDGFITGDVNGDGVINGKDSNILRQILSGSYSTSDIERLAADVNRDGIVNGVDANYISRYIAGNITDFD